MTFLNYLTAFAIWGAPKITIWSVRVHDSSQIMTLYCWNYRSWGCNLLSPGGRCFFCFGIHRSIVCTWYIRTIHDKDLIHIRTNLSKISENTRHSMWIILTKCIQKMIYFELHLIWKFLYTGYFQWQCAVRFFALISDSIVKFMTLPNAYFIDLLFSIRLSHHYISRGWGLKSRTISNWYGYP